MKKAILSLFICLVGLVMTNTLNAQTYIEPIQEYQIDTVGSAQGLDIPAGFIVSFPILSVYHNPDTTGWLMEVQSYTYKDSTYQIMLKNDDVSSRLIFAVDSTYIDSSNAITIGNHVVGHLYSKYGGGNVTRVK